jgi:CheY-like chemotaxis protein
MKDKRVVLIDDDPVTNLVNTRIFMKHFTIDVNVFTNPLVALANLKEAALAGRADFPDYIFLDINMPEMEGWDFLDAFQQFPNAAKEKCQIIILTSSIDFCDIDKSKTYTAVQDFISKPLTVEKIHMLR